MMRAEDHAALTEAVEAGHDLGCHVVGAQAVDHDDQVRDLRPLLSRHGRHRGDNPEPQRECTQHEVTRHEPQRYCDLVSARRRGSYGFVKRQLHGAVREYTTS